jgi:hypothetical protein
VNVTGVSTPTIVVATAKVAVEAPGRTFTVAAAALATTALLLVNVTTNPAAGAGVASVIVPVDATFPATTAGENVSEAGWDNRTLTVPFTDVPFAVAVTVTFALAVTAVDVAWNVAEVCPAATVTDAGTTKAADEELNATTCPPTGAGSARVTVPVVPYPPVTLDGENETPAGTTGRTLIVPETVAPFATPESVAVLPEVAIAVVTVKVADDAPAATVTEAGTVTPMLLLDNVTARPPVGAGPTNVTVPVAFWPPTTSDGVTVSDAGTVRCTVSTADLVVPFAVAVMVESVSVPTADVATVNVATVCPAAIVTVFGTDVAVPVLLIATTRPLDGAGPVIVTDAVLELPPMTDVGASVMPSTVGRLTVRVVVLVTPFADALSVAVTFDDTETVLAAATAFIAPSGTVIVAGTVTATLLDVNATANPPAGAGPARVTVTSADVPPITDPGETVSESTTLRRTVTCVVLDVSFADAVTFTALSATTALVVTSKDADVAFLGTITETGTPADVESDVNDTVKPPSGAGPVNVTVPVAVPPPIRLDGETATAETPLRVIVNAPDLL